MSSSNVKPGWKDIPLGGVSWKPSEELKTGDWRGEVKPVVDNEKCKECLFCWIFCPDAAILWDGEKISIQYNYCKGCGICAKECPFDAITMMKE
jgi:pyruvate ferredoxin oxidoreductase delta subunit